MKVFMVHPEPDSKAVDRIIKALIDYAPDWVKIVNTLGESELAIIHVVGRRNKIMSVASRANNYVIAQYCLRSTMTPSTNDWIELWENSKLVWSYYNLFDWCKEENTQTNFNFYHSPLGVDSDVFTLQENKKEFIICTTGQSALTESVREACIAAQRTGSLVFHLGPNIQYSNALCRTNIPDIELVGMYNKCSFVSGLRRTEGFELPGIEGLLCGARPIYFDQPHYRQWFDEWAEFIPEESRGQVIDRLERLFREGAKPVSEDERLKACEVFNWETIVKGFWDRCL